MTATLEDSYTVIRESITLATGEVLSRSEEDAEQHAYKNEDRVYRIDISARKIPLLMTPNKGLFDRIGVGAMQVYEKMYSNLSGSTFFVGRALFESEKKCDETLSALKKVESSGVELTPVEMFFTALAIHRSGGSVLSTEELCRIAKNHSKTFETAVFDSIETIYSALDPWRSRLGWENYFLVLGCDFGDEELNYFESGDGDFDLYKKYLTAFWDDRTTMSTTFDECEPASDSVRSDYRAAQFDLFVNIPFEVEEFVDVISSVPVGELRKIKEGIPNHPSSKVVVEIVEKLLAENKNENTMETSQLSLDLWFKLTESVKGSLLPVHEMGELSSSVMRNASCLFGYRSLLEEAVTIPDFFKTLKNAAIFDSIFSRNLGNWITDFRFADYTLLKLCEKVGARQTVEMICRVLEDEAENYALSYDQWMECADRYDEVKEAPISWWGSML